MYFHGSPTPRQLKELKAARAAEMKLHLEAMKHLTIKYAGIVEDLEALRLVEVQTSNAMKQQRITPDQVKQLQARIKRRQTIMQKKLDNFYSVKCI